MPLREKYRHWSEIARAKKLRKGAYFKILLALGVSLLFTLLFPGAGSIEEPYHAGTVWTQNDLYAPFAFPINKDQHQYEQEQAAAAQTVNPVIVQVPDLEKGQAESLAVKLVELKNAAVSFHRWKQSGDANDSLAFDRAAGLLGIPGIDWNFVDRYIAGREQTGHPFGKIESALNAEMADVYRGGVIDSATVKQQHKYLSLRRGTMEQPFPTNKLFSLSEARLDMRTRLENAFGDQDTFRLANAIGEAVLMPNLLFDRDGTTREVQAAVENVPRTLGYVQEGERIIGKNERITDEVKMKLDSFQHAKAERGTEVDVRGQRFGVFFHVLLIFSLYITYLFLFRKKIFHNNTLMALIAVIFCIEGIVAFLSRTIDVSFPAQYLIIVPAASMLLTIIFDSRVAFYGTVTLALLIAGIRGNDYAIAFSSIIAGALGAYTVRDVRSRTQIFRSLGFIFMGYAFSIIALGLERYENFPTITMELVLAFTNALLSSVFTYAMLIFLERFFNITTDLRLMELADFNQPLLQRLSEDAPGTFHHSVLLGNLAEAAADDIGANAILARVGAYYHDVGKLIKPEYFVENQVGTPNRHMKLKPRMSAKIIISHVTEGIELARENGVPEKIVDFIPQHHGTTRISYFFDKALKQAAARKNNKEIVREEDYRYPGPKPQSREAAIVMLADTVEASTRAITEMTQQKLEATIDNMIKQRFVEGELDDCELTMRDLTKIRGAFLQILIGIHHHRIQYPQQQLEEQQQQLRPAQMVQRQRRSHLPAPPIETIEQENLPVMTTEIVQGEPHLIPPPEPEAENPPVEELLSGTAQDSVSSPGSEEPSYDTFGETARPDVVNPEEEGTAEQQVQKPNGTGEKEAASEESKTGAVQQPLDSPTSRSDNNPPEYVP